MIVMLMVDMDKVLLFRGNNWNNWIWNRQLECIHTPRVGVETQQRQPQDGKAHGLGKRHAATEMDLLMLLIVVSVVIMDHGSWWYRTVGVKRETAGTR
jgi:hypothetical protein